MMCSGPWSSATSRIRPIRTAAPVAGRHSRECVHMAPLRDRQPGVRGRWGEPQLCPPPCWALNFLDSQHLIRARLAGVRLAGSTVTLGTRQGTQWAPRKCGAFSCLHMPQPGRLCPGSLHADSPVSILPWGHPSLSPGSSLPSQLGRAAGAPLSPPTSKAQNSGRECVWWREWAASWVTAESWIPDPRGCGARQGCGQHAHPGSRWWWQRIA